MSPLEGIGDYVDITAVVNPWQAAVIIVLIFALLIWPSLSARSSAKRIEKSLTTNNGGSTTKDALDEIKATLVKQGKKLDEHIDWSEGYVKDTAEKIAEIADRQPTRRRRWFL